MGAGFASVDIGNTFVKLIRFDQQGDIVERETTESVGEAVNRVSSLGITEIVYCSTRLLSSEEKSQVGEQGWWEFTSSRRLPLAIDYATPETLGTDRLAAAIGAASMFPDTNMLIADLGTAMTLDVVTADGRFKGGNISPGIKMRFDALHTFTSKLPEVGIEGPCPELGYDTPTAIRAGVCQGIVNEIIGTVLMIKACMKCSLLILSGGGAEFVEGVLRSRLKGDFLDSIRLERVDFIVEKGLMEAYNYNHDK